MLQKHLRLLKAMNFSINIDKLNAQIEKINRSRGGMHGLMKSLTSMGYVQPNTYQKYGFGLRDVLWNVAGLTMMFGIGFGLLSLGHTKTAPITIEKLKTRVDRHVSFLYKFFNIRLTDPQLAKLQMKHKFTFDQWFKVYHTTIFHDANEILDMWHKIEPTIKALVRDLDAIAPKEMKEKVKEQVKKNKEMNFSGILDKDYKKNIIEQKIALSLLSKNYQFRVEYNKDHVDSQIIEEYIRQIPSVFKSLRPDLKKRVQKILFKFGMKLNKQCPYGCAIECYDKNTEFVVAIVLDAYNKKMDIYDE